jgi:hypothetical protein
LWGGVLRPEADRMAAESYHAIVVGGHNRLDVHQLSTI